MTYCVALIYKIQDDTIKILLTKSTDNLKYWDLPNIGAYNVSRISNKEAVEIFVKEKFSLTIKSSKKLKFIYNKTIRSYIVHVDEEQPVILTDRSISYDWFNIEHIPKVSKSIAKIIAVSRPSLLVKLKKQKPKQRHFDEALKQLKIIHEYMSDVSDWLIVRNEFMQYTTRAIKMKLGKKHNQYLLLNQFEKCLIRMWFELTGRPVALPLMLNNKI